MALSRIGCQSKRGTRFLFARDPDECGGPAAQWGKAKNVCQFEIDHKLWRPRIWDRTYLRVLRAAATAVGLEAGRVDSRILRRSRGQEIILIERKAGKSERGILEIAAAFLRDSPATIERHYARLLPKDAGQSQHGEHRLEP